MARYSVQPRDKTFAKCYGFLLFDKKIRIKTLVVV